MSPTNPFLPRKNGTYVQIHQGRYAEAVNKLLANIQWPSLQPPPKMILSTIDVNLQDIRKWAILDSGASSHFLVVGALVVNKQVSADPMVVAYADGAKIISREEGLLDLPELPDKVRRCYIFQGLASHLLTSVVKLCDAGCKVSFTKFGVGVQVRYRGRFILYSSNCTKTGL